MYTNKAVLVRDKNGLRAKGDPEISGALQEGVYAARCAELEAENERLRRRLQEAEARVGLFCWGIENERERRLAAQCRLNRKKASIWTRVARALGA